MTTGNVKSAIPNAEKTIKQVSGFMESSSLWDVPAGVCHNAVKSGKSRCGRWIIKLMENSKRIAKAPKISVPKIKFIADEARA
jgi:hypothetical protein